MSDPLEWTAAEAADAIRAGEISSVEYTEALLARCEAGRELNAFIGFDPDAVRVAATEADRRGADGPLHGVPLALKDNIDTRCMPTTAGTPSLRDHRPETDAPVARALFDAGALLLGKTNMHELAFGITTNNAWSGPARNPYDPSLIPGGSSGGTGVAVAARMAPAGLGTDTGGSVRIPAALCGVVGLRPSTGRYPQAGIVPISSTRDTAGPIARTVADCALLDGLLADDRAPLDRVAPDGLRLGVPRRPFYEDLDAELAETVEAALERLDELGVSLVEVDLPTVARHNEATSFPVALYEVVVGLTDYLTAGGLEIDLATLARSTTSPDVHGLLTGLLGDSAMPEEVYRAARDTHRPALRAALARCFTEHDLAALVFPTTPLPARPIGDDETVELLGDRVPTFATFIRNTDPGSNAGLPGVSLPVGLTRSGLPVGLELDGPEGSDRRLLAVAAAIESAGPTPPLSPAP